MCQEILVVVDLILLSNNQEFLKDLVVLRVLDLLQQEQMKQKKQAHQSQVLLPFPLLLLILH